MKRQLKEQAGKEGRTVSDIVRRAITLYLETNSQQQVA